MNRRIKAFDGLRGLAILLVIINHIPIETWLNSLPTFFINLRPLIQSNGKTGVSILFMMTGFLMAYLYPKVENKIEFWGKRYFRLLPPFLTMVLSLGVIKILNEQIQQLNITLELSIILAFAFFCNLILKKTTNITNKISGKFFTFSFIILQLSTAFWYVFYLQNIPPSIFYQKWSQLSQDLSTILVNATFTTPFGRYIGQIDGVYWALIVEIFFYLLYPIFFLPILKLAQNIKSNTIKMLLLLSTLPFSFGLKVMADRILGFDMMQLHLVIYLIFGVVIGNYLKNTKQKIEFLPKIFLSKLSLFSIILTSLFAVYLYKYIPNFYHPVVQVVMVIPIGLLFLVLGSNYTKWSNYFDKPILNWFGKYSYAIYLVHSTVIYWTQRLIVINAENAFINGIIVTIVSFSASLLFAKFLYKMTEAPYIEAKKMSLLKSQEKTKSLNMNVFIYFASFLIFIALTLFISFKPPLAFFTNIERHYSNQNENLIEITTQPVLIEFIATKNNLGNITTNIKKSKITESTYVTPESVQIVMTIYDENLQMIATSSFSTVYINNDMYHPFGFPIQTNSSQKKFYLEYKLSEPDPAFNIMIDKTDGTFAKVYFLDKSQLLKQPTQLIQFLWNKLLEPTQIKYFWITLLYILPFLSLLTYGYIKQKMNPTN